MPFASPSTAGPWCVVTCGGVRTADTARGTATTASTPNALILTAAPPSPLDAVLRLYNPRRTGSTDGPTGGPSRRPASVRKAGRQARVRFTRRYRCRDPQRRRAAAGVLRLLLDVGRRKNCADFAAT